MVQKISAAIAKWPKLSKSSYFNLVIAACLALCFSFLYVVRQHVSHPLAGDEPHYLTIDYSLDHDHDFDLKNNWQNHDYYRYYPAPIDPHVSPINIENPSSGWYSFHGVGLPAILLPAFLISERTGPIIFMILIALTTLYLTYLWSYEITRNRKASLLGMLLLASCYFFNSLAGYIYPDLVSASLILGALLVLAKFASRKPKPVHEILFAIILGMMMFVHVKSLAVVAPLGLLFMYRSWQNEKHVPKILIGLAGLMAIIFFWLQYRWFGVLNPTGIYPSNVGISVLPVVSLPAVLFDAKRGLLVYNPILLLIFSGVFFWWRKNRESLANTLLALVPALLLTMSFSEWYGGYAPTGRYFMDFVPAFMPALVFVLVYSKTRLEKLFIRALAAMTVAITLMATYIKLPYQFDDSPSEFFTKLDRHLFIHVDKLLPNYTIKTVLLGRLGMVKALFWVVVLGIYMYVGYHVAQKQLSRPKRVHRLRSK